MINTSQEMETQTGMQIQMKVHVLQKNNIATIKGMEKKI